MEEPQSIRKVERVTGRLGGQLVLLVYVMPALEICVPKHLFFEQIESHVTVVVDLCVEEVTKPKAIFLLPT